MAQFFHAQFLGQQCTVVAKCSQVSEQQSVLYLDKTDLELDEDEIKTALMVADGQFDPIDEYFIWLNSL